MPLLTIRHTTEYSYRQPVSFGEHRIMMRPRESFDQRLLRADLHISPYPSELRWLHDVLGNSVAIALFDTRASALRVVSEMTLDHIPLECDQIDIEDYARHFPFTYASEDMPDLLRSIERQYLDIGRVIDRWANEFLRRDGPTDTLALLTDMATTIKQSFTYVPRHEKGTQSPIETLTLRQGTCRDFAVLMIEAVRALGMAARFVSGYVYNPGGSERVGGGNTHAWVRVFLPGSGWIEFDPTNGIVGSPAASCAWRSLEIPIRPYLYRAPGAAFRRAIAGCRSPWMSSWVKKPRAMTLWALTERTTAGVLAT
jgi:transglutaminase-like putative cysteine protease